MKKRQRIIYIILIVLLLISIFFFALRTYEHYSAWKEYRTYFKNPDARIESWMNIKTISEKFNISYDQIFTTIGADKQVNIHMSLDIFCKVYNKNCPGLVEALRSLAK